MDRIKGYYKRMDEVARKENKNTILMIIDMLMVCVLWCNIN